MIEGEAPGGQAGTSSRIENYLGFPTGISGQALAGRAQVQAQKFGAKLAISREVAGIDCARNPFVLRLRRRRRGPHRNPSHRLRRAIANLTLRITTASRGMAFITPRRRWRPSSAKARKSSLSEAATLPVRPRFSSRARPRMCT
ncbi:protein of unknown function [Methylocella tundrae]|uniref:Uncharacterized protein n=1 Tax=Methylocella tundrae TaxID=227605 RepID=A0A4U8Z2H8_METTU|nr:protein of unknown function [Methylocella tundrae]